MKLSNWGKWEGVRLKLIEDFEREKLLPDHDKEKFSQMLLDQVIRKMLAVANKYVQEHLGEWKVVAGNTEEEKLYMQRKRQILKDSFSASLGALRELLGAKLSEEQKNKVIIPSIELAQQIVEDLQSELIEIGDFSKAIKEELLAERYGDDFAIRYPSLYNPLYLYDVGLSQGIRERVCGKVKDVANQSNSAEKKAILLIHAEFLDSLIASKEPDEEFLQNFHTLTGKTLNEYRENVQAEKQQRQVCTI